MKFDYVIGNPPYQEEAENISAINGQAPRKSVFQYFQIQSDEISKESTVMIYPGGRWIQRSGKGMNEFGMNQINDKRLQDVYFYPNSGEIFQGVAIADGVSIVIKKADKKTNGFKYIYCVGENKIVIALDNPGEEVLPLNPNDLSIGKKIKRFVDNHNLSYLHDRVHPRSLFGIESDFVEKNKTAVRLLTETSNIDLQTEIKLYTNDKAGKAGRTTWFIANRNIITTNPEYITKWKVVVSSANAGGQKRDNQLEVLDNYTAFGRSRVALASFETKEEADNFYKYVKSYIVKFAFLLTDEALTTLALSVPDLNNYRSDNGLIDFSKNIDEQLCSIMELTENEFSYIKNRITELR